MRMFRWWWFLVLAVLFIPSFDCLFRDRLQIANEQPVEGFDGIPGTLAASFETWETEDRQVRRITIRDGVATIAEFRRKPPVYVSEPWPSWLPRRFGDLVVTRPYASSPDGGSVAAGAEDDLPHWERPRNPGGFNYNADILLIVDLESHAEIARVDSLNQWQMEGVAWSPDGRYVAVMRLTAERGYCWLEAIFLMLGKSWDLSTYYVDVYNLDGELEASQKLLSRSSNIWDPEITWRE